MFNVYLLRHVSLKLTRSLVKSVEAETEPIAAADSVSLGREYAVHVNIFKGSVIFFCNLKHFQADQCFSGLEENCSGVRGS